MEVIVQEVLFAWSTRHRVSGPLANRAGTGQLGPLGESEQLWSSRAAWSGILEASIVRTEAG